MTHAGTMDGIPSEPIEVKSRWLRRKAASLARRPVVYGPGDSRALTPGQKRQLQRSARKLTRPTQAGQAWGALTAKALAIYEALLWRFHNAATGRCFPSYTAIAEASGASRQTVARCLPMLEAAGLLTWTNRVVRVLEGAVDEAGRWCSRLRVVRTSNAYVLATPAMVDDGAGNPGDMVRPRRVTATVTTGAMGTTACDALPTDRPGRNDAPPTADGADRIPSTGDPGAVDGARTDEPNVAGAPRPRKS